MSFIFSQVNPSKIGEAAQPYGAADFYGAALDQGIHDQAFQSIYRMSEYHVAQDEDPVLNPLIPAAEANHSAQQEGLDLKFTLDPTLDEYNVLMDRKIKERDRNLILSGGADGIMRSAGAVGVGFLGSILNPLDLALNFVPIVGTGAKVGTAAKAGTIGARIGGILERGLITEETLAARGLAMRGYTAAIIEGTVGQAITEIPLMISNQQDQTKYDANDFMTNVALGGAFGVGVHSLVRLGKSIHGRMKEAKLAHSRLTPETHENMAGSALEDFVAGGEIDPARVSLLDDTVNETKAKIEQTGSPGITNRFFSDSDVGIHISSDKISAVSGGRLYFTLDDSSSNPYINAMGSNEGVSFKVSDATDPIHLDIKDLLDRYLETNGHIDTALDKIHDSNLGEDLVLFLNKIERRIKDADSFEEYLGSAAKKISDKHTAAGDAFLGLIATKNPELFESIKKQLPLFLDKTEGLPVIKIKVANDQLEAYKNHESTKATEKAKQLDQEIAGAKTLESVDDHLYTGNLPELDAELKKLDSEIAELEDELGIEAYGDFELDPRITGDVANVAPILNRELIHWFDKQFDLDMGDSPTRGPIFFTSKSGNAQHIWSWRDSSLTIDTGKQSVPIYVDPWDGLLGDSAIKAIQKTDDKLIDDLDAFVQEHTSANSSIFRNGDDEVDTYGIGEQIQDAWESKHKFGDTSNEMLEQLSKILKEYHDRDPAGSDRLMEELSYVILDRGEVDFAKIQQAELAIPFSRWKAFLPENPPGNHTWKAEDVTYAAQQFIPEYKPLFDELFELDPTLKEIKTEFDPFLLSQHNAAGMYKGSEDRILMAEDYAQPSTMLHELTHASVVRRMRKDMESVGELKGLVMPGTAYLASLRRYAALTENNGFKGIVEAYITTLDYHKSISDASPILSGSIHGSVNAKTWESFSRFVEEPQYGLMNLDEFIAEGISNRQFQLYLNNIKSGKETILSKFIKMVKSVFKLEENPNSVLAQLLDGYETAIKSAGSRTDGPKSLGMARATVNDIGAPVLAQASNCILL